MSTSARPARPELQEDTEAEPEERSHAALGNAVPEITASEQALRDILDSIRQTIVLLSPDGTPLYANCRRVGIIPEATPYNTSSSAVAYGLPCNPVPMTLRIERVSARGRTVVRLIGRVQSECLAEIEAQLEGAKLRPALDLEEVTLVDVAAVRYLSVCEQSGIELLHCAPYIRHRMAGDRPGQGDGDSGDKAERKGWPGGTHDQQ